MTQRGLFPNEPNLTEFYKKHIQSEIWKAKRREVRQRSSGRCEGYFGTKRCTNQAVDVHHETYETLGNENLAHLKHLCRSCHIRREEEKQDMRRTKAVCTFAEKKHGPCWSSVYDYEEMEDEFDFWLSTKYGNDAA